MKTKLFCIIVCISLLSLALMSCGGKQSLNTLTSAELFKLGTEKYEQEKYIKAIEHFQTLVYNYPGESVVDTAQYYLALSYFGDKEYEIANVEFNRLAVNYPASTYAEDAIFMKAVCLYKGTPTHYGLDQSDLLVSIKQFEEFIIDFPESNVIVEAQSYLLEAHTRLARKYYNSGVVYDRIGTYKSAEIYFQIVVDEYTDTEYAPLATFGLAEMKFKLKEYKLAKEKFSDFMIVFKDHFLVEKAKEYIEKAAFSAGELSYKKKEFPEALEYFQAYVTEFPSHKHTKKATEYIQKINAMPQVTTQEENENS